MFLFLFENVVAAAFLIAILLLLIVTDDVARYEYGNRVCIVKVRMYLFVVLPFKFLY